VQRRRRAMTETTEVTKTHVFISYSRRDSAFVSDLLVSLESYGFETFFDRDDLAPG
jgi:predicted nucleotidyltransferase